LVVVVLSDVGEQLSPFVQHELLHLKGCNRAANKNKTREEFADCQDDLTQEVEKKSYGREIQISQGVRHTALVCLMGFLIELLQLEYLDKRTVRNAVRTE
jgi:hypothetical protein